MDWEFLAAIVLYTVVLWVLLRDHRNRKAV